MLRSSALTMLYTSFLFGALTQSCIYGQSVPLVEEVVASPQGASDERISLLLRIPAPVIAKSVDRDFYHTSPIQREILGTRSTGVAECHGSVTCELVEHSTGAQLSCRVSGTITSDTCGTNGPAIIQAHAHTDYTAYKLAIFDGHRFTTSPATVQLKTQIKVTGIGSSLPGLRGRIVRRVATKKSIESHAQAESITTDLTAQELCQRIDVDFDERIQKLNLKIERNVSVLKQFGITGERLVVRSFRDCVEVGVLATEQDGKKILGVRRPAGESIELWIKLAPTNLLEQLTMVQLLKLVPIGLSRFLEDHPRLAKLDKKINVEFYQDWIVLDLQE